MRILFIIVFIIFLFGSCGLMIGNYLANQIPERATLEEDWMTE